MNIALIIATFLIGVLAGISIKSYLFRRNENIENTQITEEVKLEFSQYKQEVSDQFILQHQQLLHLTEQLNRLNKHWNETSRILDNASEIKPLPSLVTEVETETVEQQNYPLPNLTSDHKAA